jgi:hypothetical protein
MSDHWERYGNDWIADRFVSAQDNIFIIEVMKNGLRLYWFDDGPELPTESVELTGSKAAELVRWILELKPQGNQPVCEYLAGYFPELQDYWLKKYEGV